MAQQAHVPAWGWFFSDHCSPDWPALFPELARATPKALQDFAAWLLTFQVIAVQDHFVPADVEKTPPHTRGWGLACMRGTPKAPYPAVEARGFPRQSCPAQLQTAVAHLSGAP